MNAGLIIPLLAAVVMAGCATSGVKIDRGQAAALQPGSTTYADVVARFGPPTSEMVLGGGARMLTYSYVSASARPESFIPIVGAFVGGADSESQAVMFRFGPDGRLVDTMQHASRHGVATGLLSGGVPAARTGQPYVQR